MDRDIVLQHCINSIRAMKEFIKSPSVSEEEFYKYFYGKVGFVFSHYREISNDIPLYRSRIIHDACGQNLSDPKTFSYFPFEKINEFSPKIGRLNKSGQPIFYASVAPTTNFREIDKNISTGAEVYMSKWAIKLGCKLNCYSLFLPENVNETSDRNLKIAITEPEVVNSLLGEYIRELGKECLRNDIADDRKYFVSSFVANLIYDVKEVETYSGKKANISYDAILYPSVNVGNGNAYYTNIAIKPEAVDRSLVLQSVIKGAVKSDLSSMTLHFVGFNVAGSILWYKPICVVDYTSISVWGKFVLEGKNILFHPIQQNMSNEEKNLLNRLRNKIVQNCQEELYRKITNMSFDQKYGDLSSKESFEKKFEILVPIPFSSKYLNGIFINLQTNEINADEYSGIVLSIPISYKCNIVNSSIVAK